MDKNYTANRGDTVTVRCFETDRARLTEYAARLTLETGQRWETAQVISWLLDVADGVRQAYQATPPQTQQRLARDRQSAAR